jgi:uncharacterized protein (DUF1778 family)
MASTKKVAMPSHEDTVTIQMRAKPHQREIIDRAAEVLGKNRTEFMIETSVVEAQKVLLDQTIFHLDESAWSELSAILDAPAKKNPRLEKLLRHKAPWED